MAWLSKKRAAEHLGVCVGTINNFESAGLIFGRRIYRGPKGKKPIVRYRREDLDGLFERQKGRPRQDAKTGQCGSFGADLKQVTDKPLKDNERRRNNSLMEGN